MNITQQIKRSSDIGDGGNGGVPDPVGGLHSGPPAPTSVGTVGGEQPMVPGRSMNGQQMGEMRAGEIIKRHYIPYRFAVDDSLSDREKRNFQLTPYGLAVTHPTEKTQFVVNPRVENLADYQIKRGRFPSYLDYRGKFNLASYSAAVTYGLLGAAAAGGAALALGWGVPFIATAAAFGVLATCLARRMGVRYQIKLDVSEPLKNFQGRTDPQQGIKAFKAIIMTNASLIDRIRGLSRPGIVTFAVEKRLNWVDALFPYEERKTDAVGYDIRNAKTNPVWETKLKELLDASNSMFDPESLHQYLREERRLNSDNDGLDFHQTHFMGFRGLPGVYFGAFGVSDESTDTLRVDSNRSPDILDSMNRQQLNNLTQTLVGNALGAYNSLAELATSARSEPERGIAQALLNAETQLRGFGNLLENERIIDKLAWAIHPSIYLFERCTWIACTATSLWSLYNVLKVV